MAIITISALALSKNTATANAVPSGGEAINPANSIRVKYPEEGKLLLLLNNTYAGSKAVTVVAGDFIAKGQGNLAVSLAQNDVKYLVVSSDRFKDKDGYVNLTFESGMTGYVRAFQIP